MNDSDILKQINNKLGAILAFLAKDPNNSMDHRKPEVILSQAGLDPKQIALIVGKQEAAIRKALQRAKK